MISAGLAGIAEGLTLSDPINVDPGSWDEASASGAASAADRRRPSSRSPPSRARCPCATRSASRSSAPGRRSRGDAAWADGKTAEEIISATAGATECSEAEARLLPRAAELARLHAEELPQKDELCGAFQTLLTLRLAGIGAAGTSRSTRTRSGARPAAARPAGHVEELPPGEAGRQDYRLAHPRVDAEVAGTPPAVSCARSPSSRRAAASHSD